MKAVFIKINGTTLQPQSMMGVVFQNDGTEQALAVNHSDGATHGTSLLIPFVIQSTAGSVPHLYSEEFCQVFRKEIDIVGPSTSGINLVNGDADVFKLIKDSNA